MNTKMMVLLLAFVSWGAFAQHDHAAHGNEKKMDQDHVMFKDEETGTAYSHYINLKDALVASEAEGAKMAAVKLKKSLSSVSSGKKASDEAAKIAATANIEDQRKAFTTLSDEMTTRVKDGKLSMGSIYVDYCPMANGGEGASWLSNEKEVKNPYFGDRMLRCGSIKETIQ